MPLTILHWNRILLLMMKMTTTIDLSFICEKIEQMIDVH